MDVIGLKAGVNHIDEDQPDEPERESGSLEQVLKVELVEADQSVRLVPWVCVFIIRHQRRIHRTSILFGAHYQLTLAEVEPPSPATWPGGGVGCPTSRLAPPVDPSCEVQACHPTMRRTAHELLLVRQLLDPITPVLRLLLDVFVFVSLRRRSGLRRRIDRLGRLIGGGGRLLRFFGHDLTPRGL